MKIDTCRNTSSKRWGTYRFPGLTKKSGCRVFWLGPVFVVIAK